MRGRCAARGRCLVGPMIARLERDEESRMRSQKRVLLDRHEWQEWHCPSAVWWSSSCYYCSSSSSRWSTASIGIWPALRVCWWRTFEKSPSAAAVAEGLGSSTTRFRWDSVAIDRNQWILLHCWSDRSSVLVARLAFDARNWAVPRRSSILLPHWIEGCRPAYPTRPSARNTPLASCRSLVPVERVVPLPCELCFSFRCPSPAAFVVCSAFLQPALDTPVADVRSPWCSRPDDFRNVGSLLDDDVRRRRRRMTRTSRRRKASNLVRSSAILAALNLWFLSIFLSTSLRRPTVDLSPSVRSPSGSVVWSCRDSRDRSSSILARFDWEGAAIRGSPPDCRPVGDCSVLSTIESRSGDAVSPRPIETTRLDTSGTSPIRCDNRRRAISLVRDWSPAADGSFSILLPVRWSDRRECDICLGRDSSRPTKTTETRSVSCVCSSSSFASAWKRIRRRFSSERRRMITSSSCKKRARFSPPMPQLLIKALKSSRKPLFACSNPSKCRSKSSRRSFREWR